IRVPPDHTPLPCRLGDAFQTGGTLGAVPPLIGDLVGRAPLDPDPGIAVCPGSHGPALAHHRVGEQAHLERPRDAIKNLVSRLHPEVNSQTRGDRERHTRDRSSDAAGGSPTRGAAATVSYTHPAPHRTAAHMSRFTGNHRALPPVPPRHPPKTSSRSSTTPSL